MAHTHRDTLNYRRRQRRHNWSPADLMPGAFDFDYSDPLNRYPRLRGGNMVMAPSASGIWSDGRYRAGHDRKAQRRWAKRRERQAWKREVLVELLVLDPDPTPVVPEDDEAARREFEQWLWDELEEWEPFEWDELEEWESFGLTD